MKKNPLKSIIVTPQGKKSLKKISKEIKNILYNAPRHVDSLDIQGDSFDLDFLLSAIHNFKSKNDLKFDNAFYRVYIHSNISPCGTEKKTELSVNAYV